MLPVAWPSELGRKREKFDEMKTVTHFNVDGWECVRFIAIACIIECFVFDCWAYIRRLANFFARNQHHHHFPLVSTLLAHSSTVRAVVRDLAQDKLWDLSQTVLQIELSSSSVSGRKEIFNEWPFMEKKRLFTMAQWSESGVLGRTLHGERFTSCASQWANRSRATEMDRRCAFDGENSSLKRIDELSAWSSSRMSSARSFSRAMIVRIWL